MDTTRTKDILDFTKQGLSTFYNIAQMTHYRVRYLTEKELQKDSSVMVSEREMARNRNKIMYHTCLAGLGIIELFAIGVSGFKNSSSIR